MIVIIFTKFEAYNYMITKSKRQNDLTMRLRKKIYKKINFNCQYIKCTIDLNERYELFQIEYDIPPYESSMY